MSVVCKVLFTFCCTAEYWYFLSFRLSAGTDVSINQVNFTLKEHIILSFIQISWLNVFFELKCNILVHVKELKNWLIIEIFPRSKLGHITINIMSLKTYELTKIVGTLLRKEELKMSFLFWNEEQKQWNIQERSGLFWNFWCRLFMNRCWGRPNMSNRAKSQA